MFGWLLDRLGRDDSDAAERDAGERESESDGGSFLRSRLDASVLASHGGGGTVEVDEPGVSEEEAEALEQHRDG